MANAPQEHIARPDFGISVRGYDRAQVDAYFGRVVEWLADAENRAVVAERSREALTREVTDLRATVMMLEDRSGVPAPQSMSAFSERMSQVMESALQAAQELRAEAEREAQERLDAAKEEASRVTTAAREEAEEIVATARNAQRAMEERIGDLRASRAEAVEALRELQRRIATAVDVPDEDPSPGEEGGAEMGGTSVAGATSEDSSQERGGAERGDHVDHFDLGDVDGFDPLTTTGVLVTAAPTRVQPAVEQVTEGNGSSRGRRRSV